MNFVDRWSYVHFMVGVYGCIILKYFNFSDTKAFIIFFIIHSLYEIKDMMLTYTFPNIKKTKCSLINENSWQNTVGDIIYSTLGFIFVVLLYNYPGQIPIFTSILTIPVFFIIYMYFKNYCT